MRAWTGILCALAVANGAFAEDAAPPRRPAAPAEAPNRTEDPLTPEQAADAVLAAVAAKEGPALAALAAKDDPDPWLVADELLARGRSEAAGAFASAAPRVDVEALPAYVAAMREKPVDLGRRARVAAANAAFDKDGPQQALAALGPTEPSPADDVTGVRILMGRGLALAALSRFTEAFAAHAASAAAAERIGWLSRAVTAHDAGGLAAFRAAAFPDAARAWERALAISERRSDARAAARALSCVAAVQHQSGDRARALSSYERALSALESLGDRAGVAQTLDNIGLLQGQLGEHAKALSSLERAQAEFKALGNRSGEARALRNVGLVLGALGDPTAALAAYEHALAEFESLGDVRSVAETQGAIGGVQLTREDYAGALATFERSLAARRSLGDAAGVAWTLGSIGHVQRILGNYAQALSTFERALAAQEALGDRIGAAASLSGLGQAYFDLGDHGKALAYFERTLRAQTALGDRGGVARSLGEIGIAHAALGEYGQALEALERALAVQEELGQRLQAAGTLNNIGGVLHSTGNDAKALASYERALETMERLGSRLGAAQVRCSIGIACARLGDRTRAKAALEAALETFEAANDRSDAALALGNLGLLEESSGEHRAALTLCGRAVEAMSTAYVGLGSEEGAGARESLSFVFDVGARAALGARDVGELFRFLESGRASALLDDLESRAVAGAVALPEDLRAAELRAREAETRAMAALRKALDGGDRAEIRARQADVGAAREKVGAVIARIQREAKGATLALHARAATLDEVRAALGDGEVLVLYGLFDPSCCAVIVTREGARIATLGPLAAIRSAVEALSLADPGADPAPALANLRRLVVEPLGLQNASRRVLLSPTGALAYVPFAALLPDATVAYLPSGTTYRLLLGGANERGEGVLALGDPDYEAKVDERALAVHRGGRGGLTRLPASGDEARAVGTVTLLGAQATEAGLRGALATKARWRAVHLACHGLVDPERPALSSLALTASGGDDGFLTCLDVFRMRIPSDLVVLSACETGQGRIARGEGLVGMTRAFMFAGAARVVCSLWKVDDEATRALMTKFYELWRPRDGGGGLSTADALRKAQEYVRSQERWRHPYYWAAWVLWGLPS